MDGSAEKADSETEWKFQIGSEEIGPVRGSTEGVLKTGSLRIPVLKMGGGYLRAILRNGRETVFGRDERELIGRLKRRPEVVGVLPRYIEHALEIRL